jgi:ADP-ribose pyrophosphatase
LNFEEKTISRKHIYKGNVITIENLTVTLPNGKEASRDLVLHPGASVVVPLNEEGQLYMVRQYRKPIEQVSLEIPAGKLDPGEDPAVCAERELKEETGLVADKITHLISIHSTPGFSNEVLHIYAATGLHEGESCTDEDEFLSCEKISVKSLADMVLKGEITDAKTIIGIFLAEKIMNGSLALE